MSNQSAKTVAGRSIDSAKPLGQICALQLIAQSRVGDVGGLKQLSLPGAVFANDDVDARRKLNDEVSKLGEILEFEFF